MRVGKRTKRLFLGGGISSGVGALLGIAGLVFTMLSEPEAKADGQSMVDTTSASIDGKAKMGLTFEGCPVVFEDDATVVASAGTVGITSISGSTITGNVQMDLGELSGGQRLSSKHRVDSKAVINVMAGTTMWTNMALDAASALGSGDDPIGGTLRIDAFDGSRGVVDVTFSGVTLQNQSDGTLIIDGRLRTSGTGAGRWSGAKKRRRGGRESRTRTFRSDE